MVMRIDQPGCHNAVPPMDDLASCRQVGANLGNDALSQQNIRLREFAPRIVHRQDRFRRFNQNILHSHPLSVQDFVSVEDAEITGIPLDDRKRRKDSPSRLSIGRLLSGHNSNRIGENGLGG